MNKKQSHNPHTQSTTTSKKDLKTTLIGVTGFVLVNVGEKLISGEFNLRTLAITALIAIGLYFTKDKEKHCSERK